MNNPKEIKELLKPTLVARYYLGNPDKTTRDKIWYKSPWRNERTASFMVDDNAGFHDFGENWHGDIMDFVGRYYNTDLINAMKILTSDFNLPEDEKISQDLKKYLKQQKDEERKIQQAIENWFKTTLSSLCDKLHYWQKKIPNLKGYELAEAYSKEQYIDYLIDIFINAKDDEKIELYKSREEIQRCGD
jgi:DNA primase